MYKLVSISLVRGLINGGGSYNRICMSIVRPCETLELRQGNCVLYGVSQWRRAMSSEPETTAVTDAKERKVDVKKDGGVPLVSSYWGVSRPKVLREDGSEWPWNCFRPWETYQADLSIDLSKHHVPKTFLDKVAYRTVKLLRIPTDMFFQRRYGCHAMMLETVAAVPGMVGGMLLHLRSLRKFEQSGGWIKALLEEAENERMHLMTMVELVKPKWYERLLVLTVQGVFFNAFFVIYMLSPKLAHRVVGYLEEEAVHSYTEFIKEIDSGAIKNIPAPAIAIDYWRLPKDANLKDVITVIRADEAHHRDVNHYASDIHFQGKELRDAPAPLGYHYVNLTTETAIVWPVSEAKVTTNWQQHLGEALAKHLTSCGFKSNLRDSVRDNFFKVLERKMDEKKNRLKESGCELAVSWALCAVCLFGHLSHLLGAKASWIHAFHSTGFHLSLSLFTLLGPGRQLILDGLKSLFKGAPNMNTLVGLGALSSFTVSSLAALIPKLGWKAFFEEPIMLIAFVLLGRNLEQRAKIKATSDMTGLLSILPSKARLVVNGDAEELGSTIEVPCNSLSVGDQIVVLPGDRVPADGIVRAGRSTVDESSFTGEPLPVTKLPGSQVEAGSINLNGALTIEVQRPGGETAMGDIVRLVEEAQSREAPVQRLADKVSGHFTYGVMALSAATFMFWNLFGARIVPAAIHHGSPVSLALQLSCSVLV